jgi:multidrug efflux pump subunit AcrA (membrane-fusion protein)
MVDGKFSGLASVFGRPCTGWRSGIGAVVLALPMAWASASEFVGLVRPTADIQVSVPVSGVVERVLVRPGQWVREGQPLMELDSTPQQIELRRRSAILQDEAEIVAARARREIISEMQRMTDAVASTTTSLSFEEVLKQRMETLGAQARVAQLEGQKRRERIEQEQAQADVAQRVLRAPASGMVRTHTEPSRSTTNPVMAAWRSGSWRSPSSAWAAAPLSRGSRAMRCARSRTVRTTLSRSARVTRRGGRSTSSVMRVPPVATTCTVYVAAAV